MARGGLGAGRLLKGCGLPRVEDGPDAGAAAEPDDGASISVGTAADNALVLADPERSAERDATECNVDAGAAGPGAPDSTPAAVGHCPAPSGCWWRPTPTRRRRSFMGKRGGAGVDTSPVSPKVYRMNRNASSVAARSRAAAMYAFTRVKVS